METCGKMQGKMYNSLDYEKTELRLGLPGAGEDAAGKINIISGKRSFTATLDLKLNLEITAANSKNKEGSDSDLHHDHQEMNSLPKEKKINLLLPPPCNNDPEKPPAPKAQVVGWPPVRSYRKNALAVQSTKSSSKEEEKASYNAAFVKVSMDGAPYLRKVDLRMYKSYQDLSHALEKMFSSFTIGNCGPQGMNGRDFMNESKLMDLLNGSEYVPTYEDKDGDWMLVGDVPWEMFVGSCKRLRIMKGSEAIGLAPRAVEKCKNRR